MNYKNQLIVSKIKPLKEMFEKNMKHMELITNDTGKPYGIWTSTVNESDESEWIDFCRDILPHRLKDMNKYLVQIKDDAKIYHLSFLDNTYKDFIAKYVMTIQVGLAEHSMTKLYSINKNKLIEDGYDGLHLVHRIPSLMFNFMAFEDQPTDDQMTLEEHRILSQLFYSWDCESTVFWNWVFEVGAINLGKVEKEE